MKPGAAFPFLLAVLLFLPACSKVDPTAEMEAKNKASMQQVFDALNSNNLDALDALIDANFIEHTPDPMVQGTGLDALKRGMTMYREAYPDMNMKVNWMVAEGDMVIAHYTLTGTNTGPVGPMPATGKAIKIDGVDIARVKDGKGIEHWGYFDMQKMMEQLGMMPPPGGPPAGEVGQPDGMQP